MSIMTKRFAIFAVLLFTAPPLAIIYPLVLSIRYTLKQRKQGFYSQIDYSGINFITPGIISSTSYSSKEVSQPRRDAKWYKEEQDIQTKINQIQYSQKEAQTTSLNPAEQTVWNQIIQNLKDN